MIDVQNEKPENEIELEKVGVEGLKKYIVIKRPNKTYHVIAKINRHHPPFKPQRGSHE